MKTELRPALSPTLVFPFAAPAVQGTAADAGSRAEVEFRILLWGVERLVTGLAAEGADHKIGRRMHVVLPGSPNRGRFGGDGAYGEAKAAFDAFVTRWHAEKDWAKRVSLVHAHIGWVRGTGLMGHNDPLVDAVTEAGVRTWSPPGDGRRAARAVRCRGAGVRRRRTDRQGPDRWSRRGRSRPRRPRP